MKNKRLLAVLTAVVLIVSAAAPAALADNTEIHISTAADLEDLADKCSMNTYSDGITVSLDNDIDLNGSDFQGIPYFNGTFNGNGHTVSGFYPTADGSHQAFFRYIGAQGCVNNLAVQGEVSPEGSRSYTGGICGINYGTIVKCSFEGNVTGLSATGLIAGENHGTIDSCSVDGKASGKRYTGGIVGYTDGTVINCSSYADVNTTISASSIQITDISVSNLTSDLVNANDEETVSDTGGIAGYNEGLLQDCTNCGTVGYQHYGYNVGGVCGRQSGTICNCTNSGEVYGKQDVGGICGQMEPYTRLSNADTLVNELDELHDLIDVALEDTNGQTGDVTAILNEIQADADSASGNANVIANEVGTFIDNTVDTTNELLSRLDTFIDGMAPVTHDFNLASQYMNSGLTHLDIALDNIEMDDNTVDTLHADVEDLSASMSRISDELTYLSYLSSAYYNKQGGGSVDLNELKPSEEEQQRLQNEYGYSFNMDSSSSSKLRDAILGVVSDLIVDSSKAVRANNEIISLLDDYYLTPVYDTDGDGVADASRIDTARDEGQAGREDLIIASDYFSSGMNGLDNLNSYLASLDEVQYSNLGSGYYTATDGLFSDLSTMTDDMTDLNNTVYDSSGILTKDIEAINDQFQTVMIMMANAINGNADVTVLEDVSDKDPYASNDGKVYECTNTGNVEGDSNTGGIAGAMGIEYEFDLEGTVSEAAGIEGIFSNTYQTKCVIMNCINRGTISGKKDNTGGIVGVEDMGTVILAESYGEVDGSAGYVGGIAGYSYSTIRQSYAMCAVSGTSYVGGIAGYGTKIYDSSSLVGLTNSGECSGAIAGYADVSESGNISGNTFVAENLGGIDGISYVDTAMPESYEEMTSGENIPADFGSLKLSFMADGVLVKEISFAYGGTIDTSEIPAVPEKVGYTGSWPSFDYSALYFSTTIEAVYTSKQATLASDYVRNGSPLSVALVEGDFADGAELLLNAYTGAGPEIDEESQTVLEQWVLRIDNDDEAQESYTVRYLMPTTESGTKLDIYTLTDGQWTKASTRTSGSYVVFDGSETTVFAAVQTKTDNTLWYIIGGAGALVVLSGIITGTAIGKKKKKKAGGTSGKASAGADAKSFSGAGQEENTSDTEADI